MGSVLAAMLMAGTALMSCLIIGADGFIGAALGRLAEERGHIVVRTTRSREKAAQCGYKTLSPCGTVYCNLLHPPNDLPNADVAFLCAAVSDYRKCEGSAEAWRANVDGAIAVGKLLMRKGVFVVYLSSVAAEWATHTAYGRGKAMVELALRCIGDPAIVRFERVTPEKLSMVCSGLLAIGLERNAGVHHL